MKYRLSLISTLILVVVSSVGCAENEPYRTTKNTSNGSIESGTVIGDRKLKGPIRPAVIGLASDAVGDYMDQQQGEMERELAQELKNHSLDLQRLEDDVLQLSLPSQTFFDMFSANIQMNFQTNLAKASSIISKFDKTAVHVIGHTDSTGTENYNQLLSERRAKSIADFLSRHGVADNRLRAEGRGESYPLFSNESSEGRRQNRRIEIFLKPIAEGKVDWAFTSPK